MIFLRSSTTRLTPKKPENINSRRIFAGGPQTRIDGGAINASSSAACPIIEFAFALSAPELRSQATPN